MATSVKTAISGTITMAITNEHVKIPLASGANDVVAVTNAAFGNHCDRCDVVAFKEQSGRCDYISKVAVVIVVTIPNVELSSHCDRGEGYDQ